MTRRPRSRATVLLATLVVGGAVTSGASSRSATVRPARAVSAASVRVGPARLPGPGTSDQAVAVAYLDPDIVLSLDVVSGHLIWSGDALGFNSSGPPWSQQRPITPFETGVVGIYDPRNRTLYRYRGGIPGYVPGRAGLASVALRAASARPVWRGPGAVHRSGSLSGLLLPDGRRIDLTFDAGHRVTQVGWPGAHGEALATTIAYRGDLTAITDPFGITRTYQHPGRGRAFELVPASWRHGPGYRHWISPVLDSARETGWVQDRSSGPPNRGALIDGLGPFAGPSFGGVSFDSAANGGYIDLNLAHLGRARSLEKEMRRRGLLDVSAIRPTYDSAGRLDAIDNGLAPSLLPIARACHVTWGEGAGTIVITVASTLTSGERTTLDRALHNLGAWAVIAAGGRSVCAEA